jgi:hypothetical protein
MVGAEKELTGTAGAPGSVIPLGDHKDKWIRAEPFAMYEENTFVDKNVDANHRHMIDAGNADHRYLYFPEMHMFMKAKGLPTTFVDDILSVLGPLESPREDLNSAGHTKVDGRELDLYELQDGDSTQELAVDPRTKLTYRYRELMPLPGGNGKPVEVANFRFYYEQTPPPDVFDWKPPVGATPIHPVRNTGRHPSTPNRR